MKITAIVITYNEEEMIQGCLESIKWADEILVIDSNSSDKTRVIAKSAGAVVYKDRFINFSQIRNFALRKAKGDWILYIDADERTTPELASEIKKSIKNSSCSAYFIKRKNFYLGKQWSYIEKMLRLFRRDKLKGWRGEVHESPIIEGTAGLLSNYLLHFTHRNISKMVEKTNQWSEFEADMRFRAHHPKMSSWRFFRVMLTAFWNSFVKEQGFKAGTAGLIESIYQSFSMFITYAKLWERESK